MQKLNRRRFLAKAMAGAGAASAASQLSGRTHHSEKEATSTQHGDSASPPHGAVIDFRYSPLSWQTAYCFPDDPHKSLIGERGELRYGHPGQEKGIGYFPEIVEFSLRGMEADAVRSQRLEAPGIPIVYTQIERPEAVLELTTFATHRPEEGRVDNVLAEVRPRTDKTIHVVPLLILRTSRELAAQEADGATLVRWDSDTGPLSLAVNSQASLEDNTGLGRTLALKVGESSTSAPSSYFLRFPQEAQDFEKLKAGVENPASLLNGAREYWKNWKPYSEKVAWQLRGRLEDFLVACARNIQQAREIKDGKTTFQVGPTVYRGLWVVDGNFILEAARYLGYDAEAQQGLEATWSRQEASGGIFAGGGREHWKDTGIALFTLVRQAELSQDWSFFRAMQPNIQRAIDFLAGLREEAKRGQSANGRYGLLAPGFGDGGLEGVRSEFTNTVWVLAGLKAVSEAADRLGLAGFEATQRFYNELRASFFAAARQEMRRHPRGFEYLPMLMNEDRQWSDPDEWKRVRPQTGQWALSHAIYPGLLFDKDDPVVKGHIALMQACTEEDIPAETGWLPHEGVWTYNAAFVAHVYLWAGLSDWAWRTFVGFLNHASPLYCWREEQPLRGSLVSEYVGDMPHNWASAECILYLRHMLALEDRQALRLLAGVGDEELSAGEPYRLSNSPTRFGRVSMDVEPLDGHRGWQLKFQRGTGPSPAEVNLPARLAPRFRFSGMSGAEVKTQDHTVLVDPQATDWVATWKT
jgi:hypothetical protein